MSSSLGEFAFPDPAPLGESFGLVIAITVWGCASIVALYDLYQKRNIPFIKIRSPVIIVIQTLYAYVTSVIITASIVIGKTEFCTALNIIYCTCLAFCMFPIAYKFPEAVLASVLEKRKEDYSQKIVDWKWRLRPLTWNIPKILIISFVAGAQVAVYYIVLAVRFVIGECQRPSILVFILFIWLIVVPVSLWMVFLRKITDPFYIRVQLVTNGVIFFPMIFIVHTYPFLEQIYSPSFDFRYMFMSSTFLVFLCNLIGPLIAVRYLQKTLNHRTTSGLGNNILEFDEILDNEDRRQAFVEFCKDNFCSENVLFYLAVKHYMLNPSKSEALFIHGTYIDPNGALAVNIDSDTVKRITDVIEEGVEPKSDLFEQANRKIHRLMYEDTFAKYNSTRKSFEMITSE